MDFSGQKSRVIDNPTEALSVAVEEGLAWRVLLASLFSNVYDLSQCRRLEVEILFAFLFMLRRKDVYAWGITAAPPPRPRAQLSTWVCLLSVFVKQWMGNYVAAPSDSVTWDRMGCARNEIMVISDKPLSSFSSPSVPAMVSSQNFSRRSSATDYSAGACGRVCLIFVVGVIIFGFFPYE